MKYKVFTEFTAWNPETGCFEHFSWMDLIEAPSKDAAKNLAWLQIRNCGEFSSLSFDRQCARIVREE